MTHIGVSYVGGKALVDVGGSVYTGKTGMQAFRWAWRSEFSHRKPIERIMRDYGKFFEFLDDLHSQSGQRLPG